MKSLKLIAVLLAVLIVSLPVAFAVETSLIYDANGNLLSDGRTWRVYNDFNQLVEIRNGSNASSPLLESYRHHPVEERITVKYVYNSSGEIAQRVLYHDKNFVTVINASGTFNFTYVYHEGVLVAQNTPSGKEFIHPDHKGSVNFVTNDAGTPIENTTFDGFGNIIAGGESTRFDYEGKEFSSVVGDYDFHFRKYSPSLGIFTQPDTLIQNVYDPQSLNRYSFERNNPYKYVDPDGHLPHIVAAALIGAVIGSAIGVGIYVTMRLINDQSITIKGVAGAAGGGAIAGAIAGGVGAAALPLVAVVGANALGGAIDQMVNNWGQNENVLQKNVLSAAILAGAFTYAGGKILAQTSLGAGKGSNLNSHLWKLKYLPSWFTSKTGQTFLTHQTLDQLSLGVMNGGMSMVTSIEADQSKSTTGTSAETSDGKDGGLCDSMSCVQSNRDGEVIPGGGVCNVNASCV